MLDPASITLLTTTAIKFLVPYFEEAAKGFAKEAGGELGKTSSSALAEHGTHLFDTLKAKFQGKPAAETALVDLSKEPKDEDNQAAVRKEIKKAIEADPDFAIELQKLLEHTDEGEQNSAVFNNNIQGNVDKLTNIGTVHGDVSF